MAKTVKFTEVKHVWMGKAIARQKGALVEIDLGIQTTDKKLKEAGAKELFSKAEVEGLVAVEVVKLEDIITVYEASVEDFKVIATEVKPKEAEAEAEDSEEE